MNIQKMLTFEESNKLVAYFCSEGYLTCGIGHNLDTNPAPEILNRKINKGDNITNEESQKLFERDLNMTIAQLKHNLPYFDNLDKKYQVVLINMAFQMGCNGILKFKHMLSAMKGNNDEDVINSMKDSLWYKQTTNRANRLIAVINNNPPKEYL